MRCRALLFCACLPVMLTIGVGPAPAATREPPTAAQEAPGGRADYVPPRLLDCRSAFLEIARTIDEDGASFEARLSTDKELKRRIEKCQPTEQNVEYFHGLVFISVTEGWIAGWRGEIFHTTDGGASWTRQNSGTKDDLIAIDMVDDRVGFAASLQGSVYRTQDGGRSWRKAGMPGEGLVKLWALDCVDGRTCWASGFSGGQIYATRDAGASWSVQQAPTRAPLRAIQFLDAMHGWAAGGEGIYETKDGGLTWRSRLDHPGHSLWSLTFADDKNGWAVGDAGTIFRTQDGGQSWSEQSGNVTIPEQAARAGLVKADMRLHTVRFADASHGWAAGFQGMVLHTDDAGATWTAQRWTGNENGSIYALAALNQRVVVAVGNLGSVVVSIDGGETWFPTRGTTLDTLKAIAGYLNELKAKRAAKSATVEGRSSVEKAYVARGRELSEKGDQPGAIQQFSQALAMNPRNGLALFSRGIAYRKNGDPGKAVEDLTKAAALAPKAAAPYVQRAFAYEDLGLFEKAVQDYAKATSFVPRDAWLVASLGNARLRSGDAEGALKDLNRAVALNPKSEYALTSRAAAFRKAGKPENALADLTKAISLAPQRDDLYRQRGILLEDMGRTESALNDYSMVVALAPNSPKAYITRGRFQLRHGQPDLAIEDYTRALELDPDATAALSGRGEGRYAKQQYQEAVADYTRAIAIDPRFARAYVLRAIVYDKLDLVDLAIADDTKAIEIDPSYGVAFFERGLVYEHREDYALASADFEAAISKTPNLPEAHHSLGALRGLMGNTTFAIFEIGKALELDPKLANARRDLALFLTVQHRDEEALAEMDKELARDPSSRPLQESRARLLVYLGRPAEAASQFKAVLERDPRRAYTMLWLFLARTRSGEPADEELAAGLASLDAAKWPAPVLAYLSGTLSRSDLDAAIEAGGEASARLRQCEAKFYLAATQSHGNGEDLLREMEDVMKLCPLNYTEYEGAMLEIARADVLRISRSSE